MNSTVEKPQTSLSARGVYFSLVDGAYGPATVDSAADFLRLHLADAAQLDTNLSRRPEGLNAWMQAGVKQVGEAYREYLKERRAGFACRYFSSKSHALYFLQAVAPTKLVDGAWLYGLLGHWQDPRFASLIKTYLEELGEGEPSKNHVVLYRKLLASQGCVLRDDLSDELYIQGALQLSLAFCADRFLPEIIGFNLGYEQLPLHLLITAYELKELGIDPYYFTLHVTVDNADSGHAKQAVDAVIDALPRLGDREGFWQRVRNGYALNFLGTSTDSIISSFDLESEMATIFSRKGVIGQYAHSDYRRVAGRTVNEWLSDSASTSGFIAAMEVEGWFKRGQDPKNSRFWKLIHGEKAKMFGVFNAYEQQVIYDWIAGDANRDTFDKPATNLNFSPETKRQFFNTPRDADAADADDDFEFKTEMRSLHRKLAASSEREATITTLIAAMSPAHHHSLSGLKATRIFSEIWN